ncbi:hypothetical protein D8682_08800 [Buttiauxella sp. 3AFRM03]|uniref:hypothetical protein n=1 Tax=Buttiauxella sp. 3AFRM03 TaxID=2479367 RepID=UPI000EF7836D|nr:hypothetical protein [Buttiauxella sp. 3AFRM03]AYN27072.1 hypothetical protein D8682_08800 [Buttiauxella sp. 3AFRM03]
MEHGADTDIDAVFPIRGEIPENAEGTLIHLYDDGWLAIHMNEYEQAVGSCELTKVNCRYPDFNKLLPATSEPMEELPMFTARLLALPQMMFTRGFGPVKFKPYGKDVPCQLILDPVTNHLYGNPFLVIMQLHANAFELCAEVLNENRIQR